MTMTLVQTVTVGAGGAASIEFTGIPQTGTDLVVVFSARGDNAVSNYTSIRFNGDSTSSNYARRMLNGDGSSATSQAAANFPLIVNANNTYTSSTFSNGSIYVANYTSSTAKSISTDSVSENNATGALQVLGAHSWSGTSAITAVSLVPQGFNLVQYSTASLYIVTKGSGGASVS